MSKRSKISKIALWTLAILLFLTATIVGLIQVPAVQTYLVHRVSDKLSEALGTEVSIEKVGISFPDYAVLNKVLVRDQAKDTMFYIDELRVALRNLDREKYMIKFRRVELDRARIYIVTHKGEEDLNLQFLIDYLQPEVPDPEAPDWVTFTDKLVLNDCRFIYRDENITTPPEDRLFNENDIVVTGLNTVIRNFTLINDSLSFDIRKLLATEQCGLKLENFSSRTKIAPSTLSFEKLYLKTPDSELRDKVILRYDGFPMLSAFIDSVRIEAHMDRSDISVRDIAWFSTDLLPYAKQRLTITTDFDGTVADFSTKETELRFGDRGSFRGAARISGLPAYDSAYMEIDIDELSTDAADLSQSFDIQQIPAEMARLGAIVATGSFRGRINDFNASGDIRTDAGRAVTTMEYSALSGGPERYSGKLEVMELDIGKIMNDSTFGTTSLSLVVKEGQGVNQKDVRAIFQGEVTHVKIGDYDYKEIKIDGDFNSSSFAGKASINDTNARVDFNGKVDFSRKIPYYNFFMDIGHVDLLALGLDDVPTSFTAQVGCEMTGSNLNNLDGAMKIANLKVEREGREVALNIIEIFGGNRDTAKYLSFYSDVVDIQLSGQYDFNEITTAYQVFLEDLFPKYYEADQPLKSPVDVDFRMQVHKSDFITVLLDSQFIVGPGVVVAQYSSVKSSLRADARIKTFKYGSERLDRIDLNIIKDSGELLNMSANVDSMFSENQKLTENIVLNASILPNQVDFMFNFADPLDDVALRSFGVARFSGDTIRLGLEESRIYITGREWQIAEGSRAMYDGRNIAIYDFRLFDQGEWVYVNGIIGEAVTDSLLVDLQDFELENLNPFLVVAGVEVSGRTNGRITIVQSLDEPVFNGKVNAVDLYFNGDTLGDVSLVATSMKDNPLRMKVKGSVDKGLFKDIKVDGLVDMRPNVQEVDLGVQMKNGSIRPFESFMQGQLTDLSGTVSLNLKVKGRIEAPEVTGNAQLENVGMVVDYFKARYYFTGPVELDRNSIVVKNTMVTDDKGHKATMKGKVSHTGFDNFILDVSITDLNDFVAMRTTRKDNDYFYGTAVVDGRVDVRGPLDNIYVNVYAKSEKGTHIRIPLESENTNASASYIQFVEMEEVQKEDTVEERKKVEGFRMDLVFEVTPSAQIDLVFDEATNDIISGKGSGTIRMEINSFGDFYMYGSYVIEEGKYPYNNLLVSETFMFEKGGSISWDGDPYNARINMDAVVRKSANPSPLFAGYSQHGDYSTIPVDCILSLNGDLFSPQISFDLEFPDMSNMSNPNEFAARMQEIKSNENELNRQFFAVLALGTFVPPSGTDAPVATGIGGQTLSNSVSGILNRYMNQMINDELGIEVGVDWSSTTPEQRDQLKVEVRKKFEKFELGIATGTADQSGEIKAIYNISPDGKLKVQAFYKRANEPTATVKNTTNQGGVGFYIRREFDEISLRRRKNRKDNEDK